MCTLIFTQGMNSFFVLFHKFDGRNSEKTLRYKLGFVFGLMFFFL